MIKVHGHDINVTVFPDKTSQVWKLSDELLGADKCNEKRLIRWDFEGEHEIIQIIQLSNLLDEVNGYKPIILECPYLPYGRQDKETNNTSCFALKTFCRLFSCISELHTFDAHNPTFFELNKKAIPFNFVNTLPTKEINNIVQREAIDLIVYPDKGAAQRYSHLSATSFVCADKVRDQLTGEITGMTMPKIDEYQRVLVMDDLCDGGRTFIEVAKLIEKYNPTELILYISHGIFSKGTKCLFDSGYDKVFTKDGEVFNNFKMDL